MDYQVIWMDEAIADLKSIVLRIAQDNPDAALRWGEKILQKPALLSKHPRLGRRFEKLGREDVRELGNVEPAMAARLPTFSATEAVLDAKAPVLTGPKERVAGWRGPVSLIAAEAPALTLLSVGQVEGAAGDVLLSGSDDVPPEFKGLVEEYYRVLAGSKRRP